MAARKVYWKALRLVLGLAKRYIQRNDLGLQNHLTAEQYACVLATLDAILTCLDILPENDPV